jgi:hypothetical protein
MFTKVLLTVVLLETAFMFFCIAFLLRDLIGRVQALEGKIST